VTNVRDWLEDLGLGQYVDRFEADDIDLDVMPSMSDPDLEKLGVSMGHRKRLLKAIAELNNVPASPLSSDTISVAPRGSSPSSSTLAEGERRQLTVLFCDMVGFTELASRVDPEILQNIIRIYEDTCAASITRYEGYVFQRLGDGIVAFFGYPLAHEGEAERAIRAGLDIIEALSTLDVPEVVHLSVRIGIATGVVVVASAEKGAVGETMNLASRLQGIAVPGSIVVSERVQRVAGGSFEYQDLGEQNLKGIARSMHAYRILGVSEAGSRFEAAHNERELTPLVGRDLELGLLMDRWALAQDGEGQVVLLSGEPGIGKSRILSALRERLGGEGAKAMRFQCSPYYVNSAFWPSINNFERALKFTRDETAESKTDKLESLIVGHHGRPKSDVRFVAAMLSIPHEERYGELAMTPQKFKDETLRTLVDLTEAAAKKQPSVLLFEDAHWADPTTLEVLDLMIDRVKTIPLLVVLTHRPEFQNRWSDHGHVTGLNLSKLTRAQSSAIVSRLTNDKALPDDLLGQIIAKTDGVPLFVEELTNSILESGELKEVSDSYEYVGSARNVTIPATLRDSLMARLDRYMPVKEIAQIGAAIGREFSYELISEVASMPQAELNDSLSQLTESALAFRRGTPPDAIYTFKHALVQDAAYDSMLKSKRQELHGVIAKVLDENFPQTRKTEPEVLAHHLNAAGNTTAAIPLWLIAGEHAYIRSALHEAIAHLEKGLSALLDQEQNAERDRLELEFRVVLGNSLNVAKGFAAQETGSNHLRALSLARANKQVPQIFQIHYGLAAHLAVKGELMAAREQSEMFVSEAEELGETDAAVMSWRLLGTIRFIVGDLKGARDALETALVHYGKGKRLDLCDLYGHDPRVLGLGYLSQTLWALGYPERANNAIADAIAYAEKVADPYSRSFARGDGSNVFVLLRDPSSAKKNAKVAIEVAADAGGGSPDALAFSQVLLGWSLTCEGQPDEGISLIRQGIDSSCARGAKVHLTRMYYAFGDALARDGRVAEALDAINDGLSVAEETREAYYLAGLYHSKGVLLEMSEGQDATSAADLFHKAIDVAQSQSAKSWELRASTSLARLWQQQGKSKEARDPLAPVYDWFTEGFDTKDLKEAKVLLDQLA
jgi:class 3 adenylate cyclase/predicted ATPase